MISDYFEIEANLEVENGVIKTHGFFYDTDIGGCLKVIQKNAKDSHYEGIYCVRHECEEATDVYRFCSEKKENFKGEHISFYIDESGNWRNRGWTWNGILFDSDLILNEDLAFSDETCTNIVPKSELAVVIPKEETLVIPAGITKIEDGSFKGNTSITSVVIPEGVTEIGESAFRGCKSITSVVIPEGVTEIGILAFEDCRLTSVVIPKSVRKIGTDAFDYYVEIIRK